MTYRSKWIQRDLEDQIAEEYKKQEEDNKISNQKKETMAREIKISEVVSLIKSGYKRWKKEEKEPGKSIQSHYGLTFTEMQEVIKHPKVHGIKTKKVTISLVDDSNDTVMIATLVNALENTPANVGVIEAAAPVPAAEQTLENQLEDLFK